MPFRTSRMIHKSRNYIETLQEKHEEHLRTTHIEPDRSHPVTTELVVKIYDIFREYLDNPENKLTMLPATDFEHLDYSPPTVIKAKKFLGIDSIRARGHWYWKFPRYSPLQAEQRIHDRKLKTLYMYQDQISSLSRPIILILRDYLRDHNYCVTNTEAMTFMFGSGYKRGSILHAKADLGVISRKHHGLWYWVYPDATVQEWILAQLREVTSVSVTRLLEQSQWPELVLVTARLALQGVVVKVINKEVHWAMFVPDVYVPAAPTRARVTGVVSAASAADYLGVEGIDFPAPDPEDED